MRKADRLFQLVNLIRVHQPVTAAQLAARLELPPLSLTDDELDALTLSVDMLSRAAGLELSRAARSLLAKINAVVPAAKQPLAQPQIQSLALGFTTEQMRYWDQLRQAIRERQPVHLQYVSLAEQSSQRSVFPLGLFYWGGKWTLGSWCYLRQDYRDFRVDSIQQLAPAVELLPPDADINLDNYTRLRNADWKLCAASSESKTL